MNFSQAFKVFELNVLRQAGVTTITPQQVGLKSDPIADLQAKQFSNGFSGVLGRLSGAALQGLTPPTPPVPPEDSADTAAQTKYRQALLVYQQQFQLYNQRMNQVVLQQIQALQQSIAQSASIARQSQNSAATGAASGSSERPIGVGGILGD